MNRLMLSIFCLMMMFIIWIYIFHMLVVYMRIMLHVLSYFVHIYCTQDPLFRRLGIARYMLKTVEEISTAHGFHTIYLHVRLGDETARKLYDSCGYVEVSADSWLVKLQGRTPNALLCKKLL